MPFRPAPAARRALLVWGCGLLAASCSVGQGARACGDIERDPLDPAHLVHVLGPGTDISYATDPPTSGPHKPRPDIDGIAPRPIDRPVQVGILERGDVLLQHRPGLADDEVARLEALAGDRVVVAPNPDLPAPIVATAWTYSRRCTSVDVGSLRAFVRERGGKGPES